MAQAFDLDGKTAIVTGAGNGLGRAEALSLAGCGANVVLNDLAGPAVHEVADQIGRDRATVVEGDVSDWETGQALLAAAQELGGFGIRVNSVHPGGIVTSMIFQSAETLDAERGKRYFDAMPLGRFGKSIEVSHLVAFLASDDSSYCTGSEFIADGGILSGPGY